jgi:hypothetical protein
MMVRKTLIVAVASALIGIASMECAQAQEPTAAYGRAWGGTAGQRDYARFQHYPYVYYPQNFWGNEYFRSSDSLYHRYPTEMQIPVYNRKWANYYPTSQRYHSGHHFILDVF